MEIILIGLSHKTAPVEIRERFCLTRDGVVESLDRMRGISGIREGVVLSTCNRLEILAVTQEGGESEEAGLRALLAEMGQMGTEELAPHLYVHKGEGAIEHLFRVASSLDSMVLGEPQILGQLKEAYGQAAGCKFTGLILNKLLHRSFFVAKRVRTETRIANQAVSVSFAAVELAKKILGELEDKRVLIVGAGEMSELAAQHLISQGVKEILGKYPNIKILAEQYSEMTRAIGMNLMEDMLQAHGDKIQGVYCVGEHLGMGSAQALAAAKRKDITVVAVDFSKDLEAALRDGRIAATVVQQPINMGRFGIRLGKDAVEGKSLPKMTYVPISLITGKEVDTVDRSGFQIPSK